MGVRKLRSWWPDSRNRVSGELGAVQFLRQDVLAMRFLLRIALATLLLGCDQLESLRPVSECESAAQKSCAVAEREHARGYEKLLEADWCANRDRLDAEARAAEARRREVEAESAEGRQLVFDSLLRDHDLVHADNRCIETQKMAQGFDLDRCLADQHTACAKSR